MVWVPFTGKSKETAGKCDVVQSSHLCLGKKYSELALDYVYVNGGIQHRSPFLVNQELFCKVVERIPIAHLVAPTFAKQLHLEASAPPSHHHSKLPPSRAPGW